MQRQRGELVPIGEVVAGLDDGLVPAIREASPQSLHHFTLADQVNQLVSASEADPDRGFMARMLVLCSLPRTNPGDRHQYQRVNGPYELILSRTGKYKLPFGNLPRLLLAWISTEAVHTQSRVLVLGDSLSEFMRELGVYSNSGRVHTRLRNQMNRLFNSHVRLIHQHEHGERFVSSQIADRGEFWWNERKPDERALWDSKIRTRRGLFQRDHPSPGTARHEHSYGPQTIVPLGLDLYLWTVTYRTFTLKALRCGCHLASGIPAVRLSHPDKSQRQRSPSSNFRTKVLARVEEDQAGLAGTELLDGAKGVLILLPSNPSIPPADHSPRLFQ